MFRKENRNQRAARPQLTGKFTFFTAKKRKKLKNMPKQQT